MRTPLAFFKFVAKAALNSVGFGVAGDLAIEVLPEVARDVWDWWGKGQPAAELRAEVQAIAQLDEAQTRQLVAQAIAQEAKQQTPQQREQIAVWLAQVPGAVRTTQRRPSDPTGKTVSAGLVLNQPADLLPLLPKRLPRFRKGDRPAGLGGDWTLEELLGTGGFGEVWKAVHPNLPPWAVKFCLDASAKRSLQNEAALLGRVICEGTHPGIVRLINAALSHDPPFLVYEFVPGGELTTLIRDWAVTRPANHVEIAAKLLRQLAGIVAFMHRLSPAIVHRDLKPANILLEKKKAGTVVRVADFGIGGVAAVRGSGYTMATGLSGSHTPLYASPQQRNGERPDPRDDVHALGVIWLHLLTGDLTLEPGYWQSELQACGIPQPMMELIGACLARRPEQRPADAGVLETKLSALLPRTKPTATAAPPPPPLPCPPTPAVDMQAVVVWQGVLFSPGTRVRIRAKAGTFKPAETGYIAEVDADDGHVGVVVRGVPRVATSYFTPEPNEPLQILRVRFEAQNWNLAGGGKREVALPAFEGTIHASYLDVVG